MSDIDVIIPVYNEEASLRPLLDSLRRLLAEIQGSRAGVIFVDDHSTDSSPSLLKEACAGNGAYRYLRLARNSGSHIAILAGLEHARGDCAVFLAADLQDPPDLILRMLEFWRQGHHVVWAVREMREGVSWVDRFLAGAFYRLLNQFTQVKLPPRGSDFALLDRKAIDALLKSVGANPSLGGEIARLGFSQTQIPYTKGKRQFGHSKWNLDRKLLALVDAFVSFSYKPLRAMSYIGMLLSLLGFIYALVVILVRLVASKPVEGWASLMAVVLVLGGVQMTMLGVLGEYLWRTLEEARRRPHYFVEDWSGFDLPPRRGEEEGGRLKE